MVPLKLRASAYSAIGGNFMLGTATDDGTGSVLQIPNGIMDGFGNISKGSFPSYYRMRDYFRLCRGSDCGSIYDHHDGHLRCIVHDAHGP